MNNLVVISGPSGSGKSTLVQKLLRDQPEIGFAVSHTTRPPRPGETDGKEYFFVSRQKFMEMIESDSFVEWAQVHRHLYGTAERELRQKSSSFELVILDLDVQGVKTLQRKLSGADYVFILPPSVEELRRRLQQRQTDDPSNINLRLKIALEEIRQFERYDYIILNDQLGDAYEALKAILVANRRKVPYNKNRIKKLFGIQ